MHIKQKLWFLEKKKESFGAIPKAIPFLSYWIFFHSSKYHLVNKLAKTSYIPANPSD